MRKSIIIFGTLICAGILAVATGVFVFLHNKDTIINETSTSQEISQQVNEIIQKPVRDEAQDIKTVDIIKEKYGNDINNVRVQIDLIQELMSFFQKEFPDDWFNRIAALVKEAFPEHADEILDRLKKLEKYNEWFNSVGTELLSMTRKERSYLEWEKRRELFGVEADEIWASELKNDKISDAIDLLKESKDSTLSEKLNYYKNSIKETYGENTDTFLEKRNYELLGAFLDIDSVQDNLQKMSPEERKQSLSDIRKTLGMNDVAISRLEKLDAIRDQRWQEGSQYMQEREDILKKYEVATQQQKIDELRKKYFGAQADTIKSEEESGFFRFKRPRIYGRN